MDSDSSFPKEILQNICIFLSETEALDFCSNVLVPFPSSFWRKKARREFGISKKEFLRELGLTPKERYLALSCSFNQPYSWEGKVLPDEILRNKRATDRKFEILANDLRQRIICKSPSRIRLEISSLEWNIFLSRKRKDVEEILFYFNDFFSGSRLEFLADQNLLCQAIQRAWSCHFHFVERSLLHDFLTNFTVERSDEILSNFFPIHIEPYLYLDEENRFQLGYCNKFRVRIWLRRFLDSCLLSFQTSRIEFFLNLGEKISFEGWERFCAMSQIPHQKTKREILVRYFHPKQFNKQQLEILLKNCLSSADFDSAEFFLGATPTLNLPSFDSEEETLLSKYLSRKKYANSD